MGFNRNAFAQMDVNSLSQDDTRQVILLGLANDDMNLDHDEVLSQLQTVA